MRNWRNFLSKEVSCEIVYEMYTDKYELPIAVEDSPSKLAAKLGYKPHSVATQCSKDRCGYHRIEVDEDEEDDS